MASELRIASDIGGTFTDLVAATGNAVYLEKMLTTPKDLAEAVITGTLRVLDRLGVGLDRVGACVHGTTLAANTLIERKGEPCALLTTDGFRDILEIGNADRYDHYDLQIEKPEPLVPREWRFPVRERIRQDGTVATPLDEPQVREIAQRIRALGLRAVAIAFIHAYRNAAHEQRAAEILEAEIPGVCVSRSSEVAPEIREYERTSTTVANVYVRPAVERYLTSLRRRLVGAGFRGQFLVMLSDGGVCTVEAAARVPIRILESGPAAGALAAAHYARAAGLPKLMSFDMGGTTAKAAVVEDGRPERTREFEVARIDRFKRGSGLPVKSPVIEMIEIGAGGGSIARVNRMGLLKVGPDSAGSDPGPACYGIGGQMPTVTDADLLLGYLDADFFLGGDMRLDRDAARAAVEKHLTGPLGVDLVTAAAGIHRVVNENMASAARIHAIERGRDVHGYSLFAFGGAGPVHACHVAEILGLEQVIVPPGAGVASAFGMLAAPLSFSTVRSDTRALDDVDWRVIRALVDEMKRESVTMLTDNGVPPESIRVDLHADMRYRGQTSEIQVSLPLDAAAETSTSRETPGESPVATIARRFEATYRQLYQRTNPELGIEVVTWRLTVSGPDPAVPRWRLAGDPGAGAPVPKKRRDVFLRGAYESVPVYDRDRLATGARIAGPAIVEERESTAVVTPGFDVRVDDSFNLVLQRTR
ncbi:MAG: hydantoinase/oxoprolinase family protein [Candidatus Rokubacteria bacterium]|nr:hydantoinase/oxoprolinase family protein [Candidatus Rokubacteria bacterium]